MNKKPKTNSNQIPVWLINQTKFLVSQYVINRDRSQGYYNTEGAHSVMGQWHEGRADVFRFVVKCTVQRFLIQ